MTSIDMLLEIGMTFSHIFITKAAHVSKLVQFIPKLSINPLSAGNELISHLQTE